MKAHKPGPARPKAVVVIAGFLFFAAAIALVTGTSLLFPNPGWNRMWSLNPAAYAAFVSLGALAGFLLLTLAVIAGAAGAGMLLRRRWAWWLAVALFAVNGLGDAISIFSAHDVARGVAGFLVACAFVFWLTRPPVRDYFRGGGSRRS